MKLTDRSTLRRLPKRGSHDSRVVHSILDAGIVAHVGFQVDGQPFVIPTIYGREHDCLYLHGSAASRMLRHLSAGVSACVTVTLVDGLVLARSAFHHSINYRSVVAFGTARLIEDAAQKMHALMNIAEHLLAGRWADVRVPDEQELKATSVLEFSIVEASAKVREGPPIDEEDDYSLPVWAGVLPLSMEPRPPIRDPRCDITELPPYILKFGKKR